MLIHRPAGTIALFSLLSLAGCLTGCYTQLYTRGYTARAVDSAEGYSQSPESDSLASQPADTLSRPGTVIVNNYYDQSPYYRGYPLDVWDAPIVSLGFYSSRYRDYYGAYWHDDPYWRRSGYRRGYGGDYHGGTVIGGGASGPYHSDKRIFAPAAGHPELRKGRRSESPAASAPSETTGPAPKYNTDPAPSQEPAPEAKESPKESRQEEKSSGDSRSGEDHPKLQKGRRR